MLRVRLKPKDLKSETDMRLDIPSSAIFKTTSCQHRLPTSSEVATLSSLFEGHSWPGRKLLKLREAGHVFLVLYCRTREPMCLFYPVLSNTWTSKMDVTNLAERIRAQSRELEKARHIKNGYLKRYEIL